MDTGAGPVMLYVFAIKHPKHHMQFNKLSETYTVSPQITPADVATIAAQGYKTIICNRPDPEVPADCTAAAIRAAAETAGLGFYENPFDAHSFCMQTVETQQALCTDCATPILAYCASGNRCSIVWAFTQARTTPADQLIETAAQVGYSLAHLRPALQAQFTQS